jgi:hypothetical protein
VNTRRDLAFSTSVTLQGPFDLPLSLEAAARFLPPRGLVPTVLRVGGSFGSPPYHFRDSADQAVASKNRGIFDEPRTPAPAARTGTLARVS